MRAQGHCPDYMMSLKPVFPSRCSSSLNSAFVAIVRGPSSDSKRLLLFDRGPNKNKGRTVLHSPTENPSLSSAFVSHPVKMQALGEICAQDGTLQLALGNCTQDWSFWDIPKRQGMQKEDVEMPKE